MATASQEFRVDLPLESASWACREAVVNMGWEVEALEPPRRLVTKRGLWGFSRDPATIEVRLSEDGPDATTIVLNGRIWATTSKKRLDGEMNRLWNAVEVAAHRSTHER